jgi:hypothetical protein
MAETRIKRWRHNKREAGMKALTIWLTGEEELRVKDLAVQERCSPSQIVQQALAQYTHPPQQGSPTDTSLLRQLIRDELAAMQDAQLLMSVDATEVPTVTPLAPTYEAVPGHDLVTAPAPTRSGGRQRSPEGQRILDALGQHPEGLSAAELRVYARAARPIGDVLGGMKKTGVVTTTGQGKAVRYKLAENARAALALEGIESGQ